MILSICINPAVEKTIFVNELKMNEYAYPEQTVEMVGGKSISVCRILSNLNERSTLMINVGGLYGDIILDLLKKQDNIKTEIFRTKETSRSIIAIKKGHETLVIPERGPKMSAAERKDLIKMYRSLLPSFKVVVLAGILSDPNNLDAYGEMIYYAKQKNLNTILETDGDCFKASVNANPYCVVTNLKETEKIVGKSLKGKELEAADYYFKKGINLLFMVLDDERILVQQEHNRIEASFPKIKDKHPYSLRNGITAGIAHGLNKEIAFDELIRLSVATGLANATLYDSNQCKKENIDKMCSRIEVKKIK